MAADVVPTSWSLFARSRGVGLLTRIIVAVSPLVAVGCMRVVGERALPAVDIVVVCLALVCAVAPDSHLGTLVVVLIGIEWLATTHDATSPWSLVVAVSLAAFHISMAAASVAPPSARWTLAMSRRWSRRSAALMLSAPVVWALSAAIHLADVGSSAGLVAASLLLLAVVGVWVRDGALRTDPPPGRR